MLEIIGQISIPEVVLVFVLVFLLPINFILVRRLRQYELREGGGPKPKAAKASWREEASGASPVPAPPDVYPYKAKPVLTPPEKNCLDALRAAFGDEVEIFPKVAAWSNIEPTDPNPGFAQRLQGKAYDYLVCDRRLGQPLTAVMFKPGKGRPAGPVDELKKLCAAAGVNLVFIDAAERYDANSLKDALGIPDLDI